MQRDKIKPILFSIIKHSSKEELRRQIPKDIVSGVVSLGGVYRQGDTAGRVICLNIGMSETSPCDSISVESLTDGVRVGKSSGVWEEVVPYQLDEVASGGYVYFAVPVEQGADETAGFHAVLR